MFHWYGFIVGLAVATVLWLLELVARRTPGQNNQLTHPKTTVLILVATLIGARAWHLITDWQLYYQQPIWELLAVWQGGLSILGAVVGLLVGIWLAVADLKQRQWWLDAVALSLPVGQAIGRLANYVNQELYGLPTSVPWKIFIAPERRLAGFESVAYYQPLFAYEIFGLLCIAAGLWWLFWQRRLRVGEGWFFWWYVLSYAGLRFLLDFFRLERPEALLGMGINQWFLLVVIGFSISYFWMQRMRRTNAFALGVGVLVIWLLLAFIALVGGRKMATWKATQLVTRPNSSELKPLTSASGLRVVDRQMTTLSFADKKIIVEVVNTDASRSLGLSGRTKIGADGMLFVFPSADRWIFWMKDMRFNLDMVWIYEDEVIEITSHVQAPLQGTAENKLSRIAPSQLANMVLELPAGQAQAFGLQPGTRLRIE